MARGLEEASGTRRAAYVALACASLGFALGLVGAAEAKLPPASDEPAPPGVTITGIGFARVSAPRPLSEQSIEQAVKAARPTAVARAVRDARRRARLVADALGVEVGAANHLELDDPFRQFGRRTHCRLDGGERRCTVPTLTAASSTVTFAIVGGIDGTDGTTISAIGVAEGTVKPSDPRRNAPIRRALHAARTAATPKAAITARRNARTAADAAGLNLGAIVSVSPPRDPFSYYYVDPALGSFGPGRYCSVIRQRTWSTDPETGTRRPTGTVRRYRCFYERPYSLQLEVVYGAG
jgi:Protein of unknown function (DUF541)